MTEVVCHLRVRGHLGPEWSEWFAGLTIEHTADGDTLLSGAVRDQAALHGLLGRVRDLGLTLVAVQAGSARPEATDRDECL
jgi:hypothetical protein